MKKKVKKEESQAFQELANRMPEGVGGIARLVHRKTGSIDTSDVPRVASYQELKHRAKTQQALESVAAGMSATSAEGDGNIKLLVPKQVIDAFDSKEEALRVIDNMVQPLVDRIPDTSKPFLEPYIHVLETVTYLKLKHPIDAWDFATYTTDNANCPKVELVQIYGALCFRIGKRILPFENAIEFVVKTDKQGSLR